jgi:DNA repair protein RecN (Recombination protein N)
MVSEGNGVTPQQVKQEYQEKLGKELSTIENIEEIKNELTSKLALYEKQLLEASQNLTGLRKKSAEIIEKKINKELSELNFKNTHLSVHFDDTREGSKPTFTPDGIDKVEFLITTNKGESPKPLAKIASGGEISRIMLAFKQIVGNFDHIPTMIFDEIDTGISGITASIVGKKLLDISKKHQIICITHLPQIAAYGDYHYRIQKEDKEESTNTIVVSLSDDEKVYEIARLLGGINITDTTLKSAEELLTLSKQQ